MPTWIIIAALTTVGITLLLTSLLWRTNAPTQQKKRETRGGDTPLFVAGDHGSGRSRHDSDNDGGSDSGADGGGGGGGGD